MAISEGTLRMMKLRDAVDEKFMAYVQSETVQNNLESLAHLALIGGRLDRLIQRNLAAERKQRRPD